MRRFAGRFAWWAVVVALVFVGCAVGPDYRRPSVPTPAAWRDAASPADAVTLADLYRALGGGWGAEQVTGKADGS